MFDAEFSRRIVCELDACPSDAKPPSPREPTSSAESKIEPIESIKTQVVVIVVPGRKHIPDGHVETVPVKLEATSRCFGRASPRALTSIKKASCAF
jgi:hypothetical protein